MQEIKSVLESLRDKFPSEEWEEHEEVYVNKHDEVAWWVDHTLWIYRKNGAERMTW